MRHSLSRGLIAALSIVAAGQAFSAEIKIGVVVSATGPAASLGIAQRNTTTLYPDNIGGHKLTVVVLDDQSDPTVATSNARKLVSENNVDIIFGSSTAPTVGAIAEIATSAKVPQLGFAPTTLTAEKAPFTFQIAQPFPLMVSAVLGEMKRGGAKTIGFIGYADAYGEGWLKELEKQVQGSGLSIIARERYNRTDTSVAGQVLKLVATRPDAVLVVGSGTPSALPQIGLVERGYKGRIFHTHGAANNDFLRVGGKALENAVLPVGPMWVAEQLPASHASRAISLDYVKRYEASFGPGSRSSLGAYAYDALVMLQAAVPVALKTAQPGTPEFRVALRDALRNLKNVAATTGVYNTSPTNHNGQDERARVLVTIKDGKWAYLGQ
jgi:branched-chain amino acid transport system substrate-binding protein